MYFDIQFADDDAVSNTYIDIVHQSNAELRC